jgi:hypothetical protein
MSEFESESGGVERAPQMSSLVATRRWLIVVLSVLLTVLYLASALLHWAAISPPGRAGILAAVVLAAIGWALSRNPARLWFCVAGMSCFPALALIGVCGSEPWIPMPSAVGYPVYFAIVLASRRVGLAMAFVAPILVELIWIQRPGSVIAEGIAISGGWVAVAQVMSAGLALWVAWNLLQRQAESADLDFQAQQARTLESLKVQERARVWRSAAARLHESVLNSIRYVLSTSEPDTYKLSMGLTNDFTVGESIGNDSASLFSAVKSDVVAGHIVRVVSSVDVALSPPVYESTRAALIEVARNALVHGNASRVEITSVATADNAELIVQLRSNGSEIPPQAALGVGTATVLIEGLAAIGGQIAVVDSAQGQTITITIPAGSDAVDRDLERQAFDKGRLLITAPLAAGSVVGLLYFMFLVREFGLSALPASVFALVAAVTAAGLVVGRRRQLGGLGYVLMAAPALVPWLLIGLRVSCVFAPNVAASLNIAGYSAVVIATWIGVRPAALGLGTWLTGALVLLVGYPDACHAAFVYVLANTMLLLPVAIFIVTIGVTSNQRVSARREMTRLRDLVERSRALAEIDLNAGLNDATRDAVSSLSALANGRPVDDAARAELLAIDARIRAAIQVDPARSGEFAVVARNLIEFTALQGRPVQVRAIGGSSDQTQMPSDVSWRLRQCLSSCGASTVPVIQVFTDGEWDFLSLVVDQIGVWGGHFVVDTSTMVDDLEIEVYADEIGGDGASRCTILVSRPVVSSVDIGRAEPVPV